MDNQQPPEPFDSSTGRVLDVHSIWYTLQGEGPFTGLPAVFLRLAGCNLQCPLCDTEYTKGRRKVPVEEVVAAIDGLISERPNTRLLVITGGEPTRQNLNDLISLVDRKLTIQIESNGVLPPLQYMIEQIKEGRVAYIVSPKTSRVTDAAKYAMCFKYVMKAGAISPLDGLPISALNHPVRGVIARPPSEFQGEIYVNPVDEEDDLANQANILACRDSALKYGYRMGLQIHKLVGVD